MIKVNNVSKSFDGGKTYAVKGISLHVQRGELLVLLGSSGSGKTTLLKLINLLVSGYTGDITLNGCNIQDKDPVALRRSMGYVFQGVGLFPHMTVLQNISIVLELQKVNKEIARRRALELMEFINLDPDVYANRSPDALSGGQKQRVGVARALASDPDILLMDEPFGALDSINRDTLQEDLLRLNSQLHKTVIFVTHDILEAVRIADRIAVLDKGILHQIGSKSELIENPATDFVRDLFAKTEKQLARYEEQLS